MAPLLTPEQEANREAIVQGFADDYRPKYDKGVAEHGGNLNRKGLLFFAREMRAEALDQVSYTWRVPERLEQILKLCIAAQNEHVPDYTLRVVLQEIQTIIQGTE